MYIIKTQSNILMWALYICMILMESDEYYTTTLLHRDMESPMTTTTIQLQHPLFNPIRLSVHSLIHIPITVGPIVINVGLLEDLSQ